MLLNEFLKEHRKIELQDRKAQEQQNEIDTLKEELKEQKSLIQKESAQVELKKSAPQTVLNKSVKFPSTHHSLNSTACLCVLICFDCESQDSALYFVEPRLSVS